MTTVYDVSEHLLLSDQALALKAKSEDKFLESVALAADLLGVSETSYTGSDLIRVNRAVVLQLNYSLKLGIDPFIYRSAASDRSKQSVAYRGGDGGPPLLFAPAVGIVKSVNYESGWGNIKSVR